MIYDVLFSPEARADLLELRDDIADQAGETRALAYIRNLQTFVMALRTFPERGSRHDDVRPGLRVLSFQRRVAIAFHIDGASVIIDRILYGGRDVERHLR